MLISDLEQDEAQVAVGRGRLRLRPTGRLTIALLLMVAGVAAVCGWVLTRTGPTDNRLLVVDETGAISLLDPETGRSVFEVAGATATPDRSALLTTRSTGDDTVLESRDPVEGRVTGSTRLDPADLTVRTVSPQGDAVALMPGPRGSGIYEPESRDRTSITVSYLDDRPPRTYDLAGNIEPEMFSYDETGLYVLEFDPPVDPVSYYVRRLDLETGKMTDTGAPQVGLNPKMRGQARASVMHPDGDQLFTLYTLPQTGDPVFDPAAGGGGPPVHAFIHVINLKEDWSYCIFLDEPIGTAVEAAVGMGISPDGDEVIVADPATSTLARVDTADLEVTETIHVEELGYTHVQAEVAIAGDGAVYVSSENSVLELTGPELQASRAWSQEAVVSGLSLSAAGDELRVGGGGAVSILARSTGVEKAVLEAPGRGSVTLLGPPRGSVTEFPLECAC